MTKLLPLAVAGWAAATLSLAADNPPKPGAKARPEAPSDVLVEKKERKTERKRRAETVERERERGGDNSAGATSSTPSAPSGVTRY